MSDIDSNFINTSKIQIISIKVTEQITPQFLQEFLKTTLESNNILITNTTLVWYSFIEEIKLYEIYITKSTNHNVDIYPNILNGFYNTNNKSSTIDLFILDNFFAVYKYGKLYCFKHIKNSSTKDIQNYIIQNYQLNLNNTINYDNIQFNKLLDLYKKSKNNANIAKFIKLKKDNSFLFFIISFIVSIIVFLFFLFSAYNTNLKTIDKQFLNMQIKYKKLQNKKITYTKITPQLIELFKYIKLENLISKTITYEKHKIKLDLFHQDKIKLLNFLTIYHSTISIDNIEFIKDIQLYKMVVQIEI